MLLTATQTGSTPSTASLRRVASFRASRRAAHGSILARSSNGHVGSGDGVVDHGVLKFPRRSTFKTILSIDGGGLRGLVPAAVLEGLDTVIKTLAVENSLTGIDASGKSVTVDRHTRFSVLLGDYVDVAAGTSTGSILATYVASKGSQAVDLYKSDAFQQGIIDARAVKERVKGQLGDEPVYGFENATAPNGGAVAAQALFLSKCSDIFPYRNLFQTYIGLRFRPKYPAKYKRWFFGLPWDPFYWKGQAYQWPLGRVDGVESVLQSAFGSDKAMADRGVLSSSLVVTSYQMDYDRPLVFFYDSVDKVSGYGALRRTLVRSKKEQEADQRAAGTAGQSDLVRVEQPFKLWQTVRASTAAPTFFPTASVDPGKGHYLKEFQMTDGGVVSNNPAMVAMTFATNTFKTKYVGSPSLAVLSLGCGTSSTLSNIGKYAGQAQWVMGPIFDILQGGAGELSAALNQQIASQWPEVQNGNFQFLRLQLTANKDPAGDETLTYNSDTSTVTLPKDGVISNDPRVAMFQRALQTTEKTWKQKLMQLFKSQPAQMSANSVLAQMDVVTQRKQLLGLGCAVTNDPNVQERLRVWVQSFALEAPPNGWAAPANGLALSSASAGVAPAKAPQQVAAA